LIEEEKEPGYTGLVNNTKMGAIDILENVGGGGGGRKQKKKHRDLTISRLRESNTQ